MLNPFPSLLIYSFFAPTLLRVAAALIFAWIAYAQYKRRGELGRIHFPVVGSGAWIVWVSIVVTALVALGLLLGYSTQWAALVGALIGMKGTVWAKRYPRFFPLCRFEYFLLMVVCLSLLLSGAGALAFDLPL